MNLTYIFFYIHERLWNNVDYGDIENLNNYKR